MKDREIDFINSNFSNVYEVLKPKIKFKSIKSNFSRFSDGKF